MARHLLSSGSINLADFLGSVSPAFQEIVSSIEKKPQVTVPSVLRILPTERFTYNQAMRINDARLEKDSSGSLTYAHCSAAKKLSKRWEEFHSCAIGLFNDLDLDVPETDAEIIDLVNLLLCNDISWSDLEKLTGTMLEDPEFSSEGLLLAYIKESARYDKIISFFKAKSQLGCSRKDAIDALKESEQKLQKTLYTFQHRDVDLSAFEVLMQATLDIKSSLGDKSDSELNVLLLTHSPIFRLAKYIIEKHPEGFPMTKQELDCKKIMAILGDIANKVRYPTNQFTNMVPFHNAIGDLASLTEVKLDSMTSEEIYTAYNKYEPVRPLVAFLRTEIAGAHLKNGAYVDTWDACLDDLKERRNAFIIKDHEARLRESDSFFDEDNKDPKLIEGKNLDGIAWHEVDESEKAAKAADTTSEEPLPEKAVDATEATSEDTTTKKPVETVETVVVDTPQEPASEEPVATVATTSDLPTTEESAETTVVAKEEPSSEEPTVETVVKAPESEA